MKKYIKPNIDVIAVNVQHIMADSVEGLDGVTTSQQSFGGGKGDSRESGGFFDDED